METNVTNTTKLMSSLEIAQITGRPHNDVLKSIRKMEAVAINGGLGKFTQSSYINSQGKVQPCYNLTKEQTLFVITKYKDDVRAKLILRWKQLEEEALLKKQETSTELTPLQALQMTVTHMVEVERLQLEQKHAIEQLEKRMDDFETDREHNARLLLCEEISNDEVPELTMRAKINKLAREYGAATNTPMSDVWHKIYGDLYYIYHIKLNGSNKLDNAEQRGVLEPIYNIISNLIRRIRGNE